MIDSVIYSHLEEHSQLLEQNRYSATVVFNILDRFLTIDSVLDLGCGIGVWMEAALVKPGRVVQGVELEAFEPEELVVPLGTIINRTLDRPIELHRRFDLALCLETAEHIEREGAAEVVSNCVRHCDIVLFSAAIPGQGGLHHVNEQPPEYWQRLFDQAGYEVVDLIRPLIWANAGIPAWYRQNMLLFVNKKAGSILDLLRREASKVPIPLHRAHPDLFHWQAAELARQGAKLRVGEQEMASLQKELAQALACAERERSAALRAQLRSEELQADLAAQNDYSSRTLSAAWQLIHRMRNEREAERAQLQMMDKQQLGQQLAAAQLALARVRGDFTSSVSWRLTAPVRAFGELLLRLRGPRRR
jgi:hypothetical protein